jgi:hypothetical protein
MIIMCVAFGYAQTRSVQTPWYQVEYDETLEQPVRVTYQVECTTTTVSRKGMDFKRVDSIHTSNKEDYEDNVWDKGPYGAGGSICLRQGGSQGHVPVCELCLAASVIESRCMASIGGLGTQASRGQPCAGGDSSMLGRRCCGVANGGSGTNSF